MKQITKRLSMLMIVLVVSIGTLSACSPVSKNVSENRPATAGSEPADNRSIENKASEETASDNLVEIYDGRVLGETKKARVSADDKNLVEKEVKGKESDIKKKNPTSCENSEFSVDDSIKGSFTKPNASETAYLYTLCDNGRVSDPVGIGGIIIFDGDNPIAHYTFEKTGTTLIVSVPDINKNGLSKIGLISDSGGQGLRVAELEILEYRSGNLYTLGRTTVESVNFTSEAPSPQTAYKISAEPSADPTFFRETYQKKDGAKEWSLDKRSEEFSLDKAVGPEFIKI